ncbi:hypothetical protein RHO14_03345 [Orbus wheelerorum]|uniref:hypothetical protein n=1 Tax=Orbus wheelerorum TaxID=3074111 RepID=UPI00370DCD36
MYREQIQQFHADLSKRRISGDIQNNELIYCGGKVKVRALINGEWKEVTMSPETDNTSAITKLTKIINKKVKESATKNTKSM